jgi:hypothetical protein
MMVKRSNKTTQKGELRVKKVLISLLVSAAMVIGPLPAMAADTGLAPGAAAGVQQAQGRDDDNPPVIWLIGFGVVVALGIIILTQNNHGTALTQATIPTTTSTSGTTSVTRPPQQ